MKVSAPSLAWCLLIHKNSQAVLLHGANVETSDLGFVEGAWSGAFIDYAFDKTDTFMGTGGRIRGSTFIVSTPSHSLDRIHYTRCKHSIILSNSLVFLLNQLGDRLDPCNPFYVRDLSSYIGGKNKMRKWIKTLSKRKIYLARIANLEISTDLDVRVIPRQLPVIGEDFASFSDFLSNTVSALAENARDPKRKIKYHPVSTISSGYDSSAAAVLAKKVGCKTCLTIANARDDLNEFTNLDDSGAPIGDRLGLIVCEFRRDQYLKSADYPEAEFLASGTGGNDVILADAEPKLANSLLFTGFHGDKVWQRNKKKVADGDMIRGDTSGSSLLEFRLRTGFIHLPIPCIGATRQTIISEISNSPEMKPWSVGGAYDRPIPRRVVEEAGVPREMFGQEKKAVGQPFNATPNVSLVHGRPLQQLLSQNSYADFQIWLKNLSCKDTLLNNRSFKLMRFLHSPLPWRIRNLLYTIGIVKRTISLLDEFRYTYPLTEHDYLLQWAIEKMAHVYDVDHSDLPHNLIPSKPLNTTQQAV
ncbi:hypothetical protein [Nitrosococcus watsonii]|uniref:hypothetical protein n=1 Tax=Nitrosococcus watsonii TaxID=473531 RepID=UPI000312C186|nr:hypothetical protein [Nitrosococcus watsonii]